MVGLVAVLLASAGNFVCAEPRYHDGDSIRCAGRARAVRLYGIDAPEMPGACRPGRRCVAGDPYASRDHLIRLARGRALLCRPVDVDHYGRTVARCTAGGAELSCAMVRDGYAVARYGTLRC